MKIDIKVHAQGGEPKGEKRMSVDFIYDQVMIKMGGGGFNQESAAQFQDRPFKERYDMIRAGRVVFMRKGKPLDLAEVLKGVG